MLDNSKFKILIVDDEIFNVEVVLGFLEDEGYQLSFNTNPLKALERIFEETFDLILLDINMPKLDGIELCRRIKADSQTKDIPVIFLSAFSDIDTITKAFVTGGVDYITKPFNGLELLARVDTHIQLSKYLKEIQAKQEKLAQFVATDTQTGLPNRLRFISIIKKETQAISSTPSRLSLMYIKLDNLARINMIHGYKNGDQGLLLFTKILKSAIKPQHTLARLFSSDFVILMPDTSLEAAKVHAQKLLKLVRADTTTNVKLTCSIGVAEYKLNEKHEDFIHRTEKLMQDISKSGGDMISASKQ